jgi:hypothetical protein
MRNSRKRPQDPARTAGVSEALQDTPVSLALERIKEQLAALNYATDAITALRNRGDIEDDIANLELQELSARRTDLGDQRITILLTQTVANPPTPEQILALRAKVKALYQMNVSAAAIDDLIATAIAIASS